MSDEKSVLHDPVNRPEIVSYLRSLARAHRECQVALLPVSKEDAGEFQFAAEVLSAAAARIERGDIPRHKATVERADYSMKVLGQLHDRCSTPGCIACARGKCG